ncbi:MAG: hypothetical protein KGJ86_13630, partial [Chloroflexota bacterium]|nr:hypothetical protein [Chloroflexota bacterium]
LPAQVPAVPLVSGNLGRQKRFPALSVVDGLYRLAYIEHDDGSADANPYDRARTSASLDFVHWSDRPPVSGQQMLNTPAWLKAGAAYYVLNCAYVFDWPVYDGADSSRNSDLSAQVLSFERRERPPAPSQVQVVLSNQAGQYSPPGPAGLVRNGRMTLSEGYVTSAGAELVPVGHYYLEHWFYRRSAGENELVLLAVDTTRRLDREASQQWVYGNVSVGWLILEVAAKAGLFAVSLPATSQFSQVVARFVVNPGDTWRLALHRLMQLYGAEYSLDANEQLVVRELSPGDQVAWSFGPEILAAQWGSAYQAANHVRVFGSGAVAESWDFQAAAVTGEERYRHVVDRQLTTAAECQLRATLELQIEQRKAGSGILDVPLHPGLELFDVISASDAAAGLSNQPYRIQAIRTVMNVLKADYDMRLELTGA